MKFEKTNHLILIIHKIKSMNKSLIWSFIAASALVTTSCNNEEIISDSTQMETSQTLPVSFKIGVGNQISTYAIQTHMGGWSNYWTEKAAHNGEECPAFAGYTPRAVLQIFEASQAETDAAPVATVYEHFVGEDTNATINIDNLNLVPETKYIAVLWVDFAKTDTKETDAFYNTQNLKKVSMMPRDTEHHTLSPELRDAYSDNVTFMVKGDGTYVTYDAQGTETSVSTIQMEAKRSLGKLRVIMTDYQGKEAWAKVLDPAKFDNAMNMVQIQTSLNTEFNALNGTTKYQTNEETWTLVHGYEWGKGPVIEAESDLYTAWVDANYEDVTDGNSKTATYPVINYNYFLPVGTDQANGIPVTLTLYHQGDESKGYTNPEGATALKTTAMNNIPIMRNCLTTLAGNFYSYDTKFDITVNDMFTNEEIMHSDENGTINADKFVDVEGATLSFTRDAEGYITGVETSEAAGLSDSNVKAVIDYIEKLCTSKYGQKIQNVTLKATTAGILDQTLNFEGVKAEVINIEISDQANVEAIDYTNLTSPLVVTLNDCQFTVGNSITIVSQSDVTLTGENSTFIQSQIKATGKVIFQGGTCTYGAITATAAAIDFNRATYAAVTADANEVSFKGGFHEGEITVNKNQANGTAFFETGMFYENIDCWSNASILNNKLSANKVFTMKGTEEAHTLYIYKSDAAFGTLNADRTIEGNKQKAIHTIEATKAIIDLYGESSLENNFILNVKE